jgi:hypothetical protein
LFCHVLHGQFRTQVGTVHSDILDDIDWYCISSSSPITHIPMFSSSVPFWGSGLHPNSWDSTPVLIDLDSFRHRLTQGCAFWNKAVISFPASDAGAQFGLESFTENQPAYGQFHLIPAVPGSMTFK